MTAKLHYYRVPEDWTKEQKLEFLRTHSLYPNGPPHDLLPRRTPRPHPAVRPAKAVRQAGADYERTCQRFRAMSRANPGHASLPLLSERLDEAREALFAVLRHQDRHDRRAFLVKWGM